MAMADYRAIMAVGEAVIRQLRGSVQPGDFDAPLEFRVFTSRDFNNPPITNGVSLFLYRLFPNGVRRTPPGRTGPDGRRLQTLLPLEMHFLLTFWGGEASLQHALAGWTLRVMEDAALLPATLLNAAVPGAFRGDETVEITLAELSTEDLLHLYEVLMPNVYQLSVPYLARTLHIESSQPLPAAGREVQERVQSVGVLEVPD
jgi:hypothetical protein